MTREARHETFTRDYARADPANPVEGKTMARAESIPRWATRALLAAIAGAALATGAVMAITPAEAADTNPYSPVTGHPSRHGSVPTLETAQKMAAYRAAHRSAAPQDSPANLRYGGAVDGIGVTTGKPKVYLI